MPQASLPASPGAVLDLVAADLTQAQTLLPSMMLGVRAVISCTAVKVVPKEGDTPDRSKYMQGIKFYDPEVVREGGSTTPRQEGGCRAEGVLYPLSCCPLSLDP